MDLIIKAREIVNSIIDKVVVAVFIFMVVVVFSQVFARYLLGFSIFWAEEYARFSMIWIAFLGATLAMKNNEHTSIDFFVNLLPEKLKKIQKLFKNLLCIVFLVYVSYYTISMLSFTLKTFSPALRIPLGYVYLILPFAGFIMIFYLFIDSYLIIMNRKVDEEE